MEQMKKRKLELEIEITQMRDYIKDKDDPFFDMCIGEDFDDYDFCFSCNCEFVTRNYFIKHVKTANHIKNKNYNIKHCECILNDMENEYERLIDDLNANLEKNNPTSKFRFTHEFK